MIIHDDIQVNFSSTSHYKTNISFLQDLSAKETSRIHFLQEVPYPWIMIKQAHA